MVVQSTVNYTLLEIYRNSQSNISKCMHVVLLECTVRVPGLEKYNDNAVSYR